MVRSPVRVGWWMWYLARRRPRVRRATDVCCVLNPAIKARAGGGRGLICTWAYVIITSIRRS